MNDHNFAVSLNLAQAEYLAYPNLAAKFPFGCQNIILTGNLVPTFPAFPHPCLLGHLLAVIVTQHLLVVGLANDGLSH